MGLLQYTQALWSYYEEAIMKIDIDGYETQLPGYFTTVEIADILGYNSHVYICELIRKCKLKAYRVGRAWLVPEQAAKIFINQQIINRN